MMLPPDAGFVLEVWVMAGAAYFAARNTLYAVRVSADRIMQLCIMRVLHAGSEGNLALVLGNMPRRISLHDLHEFALLNVLEVGGRAHDTRVGEEDVEPAVPRHSLLDHCLHGRLVGGIELSRVHLDVGVELAQVALVGG